ncbi:indole-3-glycerol phosphate synthase TrpC [Trichothermofontia sp.]
MQVRRRPPNPPVTVQHLSYHVRVPDAEPQHILEKIVWHKEREVDQWREQLPLADLRRQVVTSPPPRDFVAALRAAPQRPAIISEVKKASPSQGIIRADFEPVTLAQQLAQGGASCLSVLTDTEFFQGSFQYLERIRAAVDLPLLCKDFLIYPYQIYLARRFGADAVLLIAAILSDQDLQYFLKIAQGLGMSALVEVHTEAELVRVLGLDGLALVGINNRNLQDFSVDINTTGHLLSHYGPELQARNILCVSESGLYTPADLAQMAAVGAGAVLIGESLMRQPDPSQALQALIAPLMAASPVPSGSATGDLQDS